MSSLPPALDFAATEEDTCGRWEKEGTFKAQDRLSRERGDKVRVQSQSSNLQDLPSVLASSLLTLAPGVYVL